jgi:UDP-N-acetyl-D-galactosamine dehydrogenase
MGLNVVNQVFELMTKKSIHIEHAKILIMGLTFKENCPDLRNTRVVDIVQELLEFKCNVDVFDPWVNYDKAIEEYNIKTVDQPLTDYYDAIIIAVAHDKFKELSLKQIKSFGKENHVLFDIKYLLNSNEADGRL